VAISGRGSGRFSVIIWPGFVDVMTALILVLFFVLSIFMIVQFVLRDTITGKDRQLDELSLQVANLADALGLERSRADRQETLVATLTGEREAAAARIGALTSEAERTAARIADFEAQVASLIARSTDLSGALDTERAEGEALAGRLEATEAESAERLSANEALQLALAQARQEIDADAEAARLAAARREALEALVASLQSDVEELEGAAATQAESLTEAEAARVAEAAAAAALRERLENADAELTAMTLNLEAARKEAEDTLTLLAAAEAAKSALEGERTSALSDAERRAAELAQARSLLADQQQVSAEGQRQVALLNQQTAELRQQLNALQGLLDTARAEDEEAQVQIETLGANLNAALARVATEERARAEAESARAEAETARAELEARERARLAEEAKDLANYRSEFFGRMRAILGDRQGVQVVGDRFVFDSEVLFPPGSATLGPEGRAQVARVAEVIREVADEIPPEINWVLRVDGHTDRQPVSATSPFADNWELSQARALSVVRYMTETQGLPADRLAATGFGEFQPIDAGDTPEALARNRRIELKFTER
jgi:chemotaxis protein MotB